MTLTNELITSRQITVSVKSVHRDPGAEKLLATIQNYLRIPIKQLKCVQVYTLHKNLDEEVFNQVAQNLFVDPIMQELVKESDLHEFNWVVTISPKPGVTDNAAATAKTTIADYLNQPFFPEEELSTATQYWISGEITDKQVIDIAKNLLANPLIHKIQIEKVKQQLQGVTVVDLDISDAELVLLSKERQLALNLNEMHTIRDYFSKTEVKDTREKAGLPPQPTDVEIEVLAQTWSEHCKHKIFNATIRYREGNREEIIHSIFKTYIKAATEKLTSPSLVSVFTDNAGIINYDQTYNLAFKVETHNSPSALDPYGGALTGILGVNRDIMGAGQGARIIANTDVFCFAPPDYEGKLPPRLLHPRRIAEGVRLGVEHGGNKSGIPTVNGSITYDNRFLGKPLVYCGSVGIIPKAIDEKPTHIKEIFPGDLIVIAGGRTGRDGVHGATFSSEELHAASPSSAVQIGDPFTQKKVHDFLLEARDLGLYRTLTDNGAGGFSSSVGELAQLSGGCEIHLDRARLKQIDLLPWEIMISESQERMTLAVPPENWEELCHLAAFHEVELIAIGAFTGNGYFHALYKNQTVALMELEFLHHGLPPMELEAEWSCKEPVQMEIPDKLDLQETVHKLLSRYNICSKESIVRQYDHEVQGGSVIKPFMGRCNDGPSDAAVTQPCESLGTSRGYVISHGICPRYSDVDAYAMASCAVDEAIRNAVAVGGNPDNLFILDNFCWPDPVYDSVKNPDGKYKLGQLVRANKALYDAAVAFHVPIISGKDSMKNDYMIDGIKISVPPTLLISALGVIEDISKCITLDFKAAGDFIYLLGNTTDALACSEFATEWNLSGGNVPQVDFNQANQIYHAFYQAIQKGLVASCHDCSDGGFAVALAESSFSGGFGADVDIARMVMDKPLTDAACLFSETPSRLIVSVNPAHAATFESLMPVGLWARMGTVQNNTLWTIKRKSKVLIQDNIATLKHSWQKTLGGGQ
jgi:phosphoribosylformylglycinamidine synthase